MTDPATPDVDWGHPPPAVPTDDELKHLANPSALEAAVVRRPEVSKFLTDRNVEPWGSTQEELGRTIEGEIAQWGPLVKKFNITV